MSDQDDNADTPPVPRNIRVIGYILGIVIGVGIGPAVAALGYPQWGVALGAIGAAGNALALGNLSKH